MTTRQILKQIDGGVHVVADPAIVDALDRERRERKMTLAPHFAPGDELCAFKYTQVLQYRGAIEFGEECAERAWRLRVDPQGVEDPTSRRRSERLEHEIVFGVLARCNIHVVNLQHE